MPSPTSKTRPAGKFPWERLSDEELLKVRLKDLHVAIEGTWLEEQMDLLQEELDGRGLEVRPHAWISDEWFSPSTSPGIAIPFYLAHPRLMRLERKMILEVEGGNARDCLRILRHEAGHVVQYAFGLHRRKKWQELFGPSSQRYPKYYRPNPASKHFVQHLRLWYAQAHPDEDFAETFAVWLKPRADWRERYADWPALKKLEYVDELMTEIAGEKPKLKTRATVDCRRRSRNTTSAGRPSIRARRRISTTGTCAAYSPRIRVTGRRRPPHPSFSGTAPASARWCRPGPRNPSSRSTSCSTT